MRPIFEDSRGRSDLPGSIWHSQNGCCDFPGLFGSLEWLNLAQNDNNTSVCFDIQNNPNYQSRCIDYDSPQAIYSECHDHLPLECLNWAKNNKDTDVFVANSNYHKSWIITHDTLAMTQFRHSKGPDELKISVSSLRVSNQGKWSWYSVYIAWDESYSMHRDW